VKITPGRVGEKRPQVKYVAAKLRRAYVSIRQHTSAYVSIRQHTSAYVSLRPQFKYMAAKLRRSYVSIRQHTSAYVSIRQHTSAYVSIRIPALDDCLISGLHEQREGPVSNCHSPYASTHVSIRQHTSAYVSIRQHTSAYVSGLHEQRGGPSPSQYTSHIQYIYVLYTYSIYTGQETAFEKGYR
jgi:hypothetical protein